MGSRRRRSVHHQGHRRQRMPHREDIPTGKPSLLKRILAFFGIGRKKDELSGEPARHSNVTPKKTRAPKPRANQGGNPAAARSGRRRPASTPPTRNARLYVGNLSYEATEAELEDLFKGFGNVRSVEIIYNPRTYKSKGYAFVEMYQIDDARRAAEVLHGQPFMGRELMVSAASEKTDHSNRENGESADAAPQAATENSPAEAAAEAPAPEAAAPAAPAAEESGQPG